MFWAQTVGWEDIQNTSYSYTLIITYNCYFIVSLTESIEGYYGFFFKHD